MTNKSHYEVMAEQFLSIVPFIQEVSNAAETHMFSHYQMLCLIAGLYIEIEHNSDIAANQMWDDFNQILTHMRATATFVDVQ